MIIFVTVQNDTALIGARFHIGCCITSDTAGIHGLGLCLDGDGLLVNHIFQFGRCGTDYATKAHLRATGRNHITAEGNIGFIGAILYYNSAICFGIIRHVRPRITEHTSESRERSISSTLFHRRSSSKGSINIKGAIVVAIRSTEGYISGHTAEAGVRGSRGLAAGIGQRTVVVAALDFTLDDTGNAAEGRITTGTAARVLPGQVALVGAAFDNTMIGRGIGDGRSLSDHTADTELKHSL